MRSSHRQVNSRVNAQRSVLRWERPPSLLHNHVVPGADVAVDDKLVIKATLGASVVGFANRQEVGRETSSHHLACIDEDVCSKQTECKHTCGTTDTQTGEERRAREKPQTQSNETITNKHRRVYVSYHLPVWVFI